MSERLGDRFWNEVKGKLGGVALAWWQENRDDLAELGEELGREIFADLKAGRTFEAKLAIVANMTPDEWRAYKKGTLESLEGIARRRAALFEALGHLGSKAAEAIGKAALAAL